MSAKTAGFLVLALLAWPCHGLAHEAGRNEQLPMIGIAPGFTLTSQDDQSVSLDDFRGKVVAVTFIYTSCLDTCPLLTDKMAHVEEGLGTLFGKKIIFVSITVDPENDTPEVLKQCAQNFYANLAGWYFRTGQPRAIRKVEQRYSVYAAMAQEGGVIHTFLTSLIDSKANLRVQYLGVNFDPTEFRSILLGLVDESDKD
jgi:protein SCO1